MWWNRLKYDFIVVKVSKKVTLQMLCKFETYRQIGHDAMHHFFVKCVMLHLYICKIFICLYLSHFANNLFYMAAIHEF